jgi:hypothetical protein
MVVTSHKATLIQVLTEWMLSVYASCSLRRLASAISCSRYSHGQGQGAGDAAGPLLRA